MPPRVYPLLNKAGPLLPYTDIGVIGPTIDPVPVAIAPIVLVQVVPDKVYPGAQ